MNHRAGSLAPEQEIALAYSLPMDRAAFRALLELDKRFADIVSTGSETMIGQLRLAWWRDALEKLPEDRPPGEPLLDLLGRSWGETSRELVALVDGWEALLVAETLGPETIDLYVSGRAAAWGALTRGPIGTGPQRAVERAARLWALADLAAHLSDQGEKKAVLAMADHDSGFTAMPRRLRPLAVLAGLAARALERGGRPLMEGRSAALKALRIGVFGR